MGQSSWGGSRGHLDAPRPHLCLQEKRGLVQVLWLFRNKELEALGGKKMVPTSFRDPISLHLQAERKQYKAHPPPSVPVLVYQILPSCTSRLLWPQRPPARSFPWHCAQHLSPYLLVPVSLLSLHQPACCLSLLRPVPAAVSGSCLSR